MPDTARAARWGSSLRHVRSTRTGRRWLPHRPVVSPLEGWQPHVPSIASADAGRPYPGRIELAALAVLYGAYELVRGFGGRGLGGAPRATPPTSSRSSAASISSSSSDVQDVVGCDHRRAALLGLPLRPAPFRGHRCRPHLGSPAAPARVPVPPHDADRQHGARARRLRHSTRPRRRGSRTSGFADTVSTGHGPEPQLRPARQLLQPDRRRAEPPLRLLADRRRRARRGSHRPLPLRARSAPPIPR